MKSRRLVRILLQLAATVLVTVFIVRRLGLNLGDLSEFELNNWAWRPLPLIGSVLLLIAGYAYSSLLWRQMVVEMGGPRLKGWTAIRIFMVANLGRYVPGKVLQIAGLAILSRREGVPATTATTAAILGQAFALAGATLIGLGAFFGENTRWRLYGWLGLAVMLALIVLSLDSGTGSPAAGALDSHRIEGGKGVDGSSSDPADSQEVGSAAPVSIADVEPSALIGVGEAGFGLRWTWRYLLNWAVYAGAFWLLFLGLEEWATFLAIAPAFAAAYVVGYLAFFVPAGGIVREGVLIGILTPLIGLPDATALAILARIWTTVVELIPAGLMAPGVLRGSGQVKGTPGEVG